MFWEICCVLRLPLFASPNGAEPQRALCDRGLMGAAAGWESNYRLWRVYKKHKEGGGHCLYIIAGHSSGKTSDGCPLRRGAE